MINKICCIFNIAPHYNAAIYSLMDTELKCDFYIGDNLQYPIKLMNYNSLNGIKRKLINKTLVGNFYWQYGTCNLAIKPYKYYIMTGEPYCISSWIILVINRLTGSKTFLWSHGWYGRETSLKKFIKKVYFKLSSHILLYGDYARKLMIEEGFNPKKLTTIFNSLIKNIF